MLVVFLTMTAVEPLHTEEANKAAARQVWLAQASLADCLP